MLNSHFKGNPGNTFFDSYLTLYLSIVIFFKFFFSINYFSLLVLSPSGILTSQNKTIGGCPSRYQWCHTTPKLPLVQYIVGTGLSFFGFMLVYVCTTALYAKIIGPFPPVSYYPLTLLLGGGRQIPIFV